jgi:hypothetical protein
MPDMHCYGYIKIISKFNNSIDPLALEETEKRPYLILNSSYFKFRQEMISQNKCELFTPILLGRKEG